MPCYDIPSAEIALHFARKLRHEALMQALVCSECQNTRTHCECEDRTQKESSEP